ncbi:MAG: hypothetical protein AAF738_07620 [Bacteroidota bacterium]
MKQMRYWCWLTFFLSTLTALEGQNAGQGSARGNAMGGLHTLFQDTNSLFGNAAGLAQLQKVSGISYAERRFWASPIHHFGVGVATPSQWGVFGLSLHRFGIEVFNEQKIALRYARTINSGLSIGGQFDILHFNIAEYGTITSVAAAIGLQTRIHETLRMGINIYSPNKVILADNFVLPNIYQIGLAYTPSNKTFLALEAEKSIDAPLRIKAGLEYQTTARFYMRLGVATSPTTTSFGISVLTSQGLQLDVSATHHPVLGITPSIGVIFASASKESSLSNSEK